MANARRGDVDLELAGQTFTLRLTLGALAELEDAFVVENLAGLGARLSGGGVKSRDLLILLGAAVRGGGVRIRDAELAALVDAANLPRVVAALSNLLERSFGGSETNPPEARAS